MRRAKYNKKTYYWWHGSYRPDIILNHVKDFYEPLFKKREQKATAEMKYFLNIIDVPKLSEDHVKLCEEDLTKNDLYKSLRSMQNDKSPVTMTWQKNFTKLFGSNWRKPL